MRLNEVKGKLVQQQEGKAKREQCGFGSSKAVLSAWQGTRGARRPTASGSPQGPQRGLQQAGVKRMGREEMASGWILGKVFFSH